VSASSYPGWRFCRVDPHKIVGRRSATGLVALLWARGESWQEKMRGKTTFAEQPLSAGGDSQTVAYLGGEL
jgi:hypothetical protein